MAFENDVFVSYSHIDDLSPVAGDEGRWISALHKWLEVGLAQRLGKTPRIWRDAQLRGNEAFADTINSKLPNVAVFISVVSPPYLNSKWCRHELEQFLATAPLSGAVHVGDQTRIFKVVKTRVERELQPPLLQTVRGYEFYTVEAQTHRVREFGPLSPPDTLRQYYAKLDDLVSDVADILSSLERAASLPEAEVPAKLGFVYLAETTADLQDQRDRIRRDLQDHGYVVLPDLPMPLVAPDCLSFIRAQMERCRLSIHMVGSTYGIVPDGATQSIIQLQHEEALRRAVAGDFCRLVWMPAEMAVTDLRQEAFLAELEGDSRADVGSDLLKTPLEDFKTVVHVRLRAPAAPDAPRADSVLKHVYLICDQRDVDEIRPIEELLYSEGLEVISSVFDGDEASILRDHTETLTTCDAALIYYGAGDQLWFRKKTSELKKSAAYGRTTPLVKGIVLGTPLKPEKLSFRSHEFTVINPGAPIDGASFKPFIAQLR